VSYVDRLYYTDTYMGLSVEIADFPALEMRASEIIDELTMYRVAQNTEGLDGYDIFVQAQFKKAVCAEIEHIDSMGGVDMLNEQTSQSMSLGKFSFSGESKGSQSEISTRAIGYLTPTGLLYRGL
jgi:hypothetical protein